MASGYRSPLRPIPIDIIPDPLVFFDSDQTINHGVSRVNNLNYQFVDSYEEHALLYIDENITNSCSKDSWWVEAIRVADDIENKKNTVELSNMVSIFMMLIHIRFVALSYCHLPCQNSYRMSFSFLVYCGSRTSYPTHCYACSMLMSFD